MELLHEREGYFAQVDATLDQIPQLQQADAELVAAGILAFDEAAAGQGGEDAVRRGGVQAGTLDQGLEADGVRGFGEDIQQRHHALNDLDGVLGGFRHAAWLSFSQAWG